MAFWKSQGCIHIWYAHKAYLLTISLNCDTANCFWRWPKSVITKYTTRNFRYNLKSPMQNLPWKVWDEPNSASRWNSCHTLAGKIPAFWWYSPEKDGGFSPIGYMSSFVSLPKGNSQHGSPSNSTKHHVLDPKNGTQKAWWKVCLKNWASKRNDPHMFKTLEVLKSEDGRCGACRISGEKMARFLYFGNSCSPFNHEAPPTKKKPYYFHNQHPSHPSNPCCICHPPISKWHTSPRKTICKGNWSDSGACFAKGICRPCLEANNQFFPDHHTPRHSKPMFVFFLVLHRSCSWFAVVCWSYDWGVHFQSYLPKTNMAIENPPLEDVFPIENGNFPMSS